jgi:trimethylamine:corrinoid methyltransferase-like protein
MAMAGGTAPVNPAGVLVQTNAEILAGIVLTQRYRNEKTNLSS